MKENTVIKALIVILLVAALGIYLNQKFRLNVLNESAIYEYNNGKETFTVTKVKEGDYTGYQIAIFFNDNPEPYYISMRHDPQSLEDIPISLGSPKESLKFAKRVFLTLDPAENLTSKATLGLLDIDKIIDNKYFYNLPVNSSVASPYLNFPVVNCQNATEDTIVIWLKKGEKTEIVENNNCILVLGRNEDELLRAADRLSLYLVGIMN